MRISPKRFQRIWNPLFFMASWCIPILASAFYSVLISLTFLENLCEMRISQSSSKEFGTRSSSWLHGVSRSWPALSTQCSSRLLDHPLRSFQVRARICVPRRDPDRFRKLRDRFANPSELGEDDAKIVVGVAVRRVEPHRLTEVHDRVVGPVGAQQRLCEVAMRPRRRRVEAEGVVEGRDRLVDVPEP